MCLNSQLEEYLSKPYWIIDILPRQVEAEGRGQYFKIEQFFIGYEQMDAICRKFASLIIKLNCYDDISVCLAEDGQWFDNPAPETLQKWIFERKPLCVILHSTNAMIAFTGDDHYMTFYSDQVVPELVRALATAEGLFVWKPLNNE